MNAASRRFVAFAVSLSMVLGLMPNVALAQGEGNDAPEVVEQVVLDEERKTSKPKLPTRLAKTRTSSSQQMP